MHFLCFGFVVLVDAISAQWCLCVLGGFCFVLGMGARGYLCYLPEGKGCSEKTKEVCEDWRRNY